MTKGKPSSLTSIAFNTGVVLERSAIIKLLKDMIHEHECDWGCDNYGCGNGYYDYAIERIEERADEA